jgi:hypothetical protein
MVVISNTGNIHGLNNLLHNQNHLDSSTSKTDVLTDNHATRIYNQLPLKANENVLKRLDSNKQIDTISSCVKNLNITPVKIDKIHAENITNLLVCKKWKDKSIGKNESDIVDGNDDSATDNGDSGRDDINIEEQLELLLIEKVTNLRKYLIYECHYTSFVILSFFQVQAGLHVNYKQILSVIPFINAIPQNSLCSVSQVNEKGCVSEVSMFLQMVAGGFLYTSDWLGIISVLPGDQAFFKKLNIEYKHTEIQATIMYSSESQDGLLDFNNTNLYIPGFSKIWEQ